jgi:hypothetical protein
VAVHVFVGPTLSARRVLAITPTAVLHPPVAHGDLLRLGARAGDVVVVVDGVYHQSASVRHKEILILLAAGVIVVGCSSMGALRAAELHECGMIGNGTVFRMYRDGVVDADDEVAVTHGEGPDYRPLSEPLVTIRCAVAAARDAGVVTAGEAAQIIACGRAIPYPERSWRGLERALRDRPAIGEALDRVRAFLADQPRYADVKATDAIDTLARLAEITAAVPDRPWAAEPDWRSRFVYRWLSDATGKRIGDVHVGHGDVVRYRQLYDPGFPRRWRRFALRGIAGSDGSDVVTDDVTRLEEAAIAAAAATGVTVESLTAAHAAEWLSASEAARPHSRESLCVLLVRSFRPLRGTWDIIAGEPDLIDEETRAAVAESHVVNAQVARWEPGQRPDHLRESVLRQHLARIWQVTDDERSLRAAARDRGFGSIRPAVSAARPFFLRHHLRRTTA